METGFTQSWDDKDAAAHLDRNESSLKPDCCRIDTGCPDVTCSDKPACFSSGVVTFSRGMSGIRPITSDHVYESASFSGGHHHHSRHQEPVMGAFPTASAGYPVQPQGCSSTSTFGNGVGGGSAALGGDKRTKGHHRIPLIS